MLVVTAAGFNLNYALVNSIFTDVHDIVMFCDFGFCSYRTFTIYLCCGAEPFFIGSDSRFCFRLRVKYIGSGFKLQPAPAPKNNL